MASDWKPGRLRDIADVVMGQSPTADYVNEACQGKPLLNGPTEFGAMYPTPVQFTTDVRKKANPGDLLFCVRGSTTGRMNWADQEYAIGRGLAAIRHRDGDAFQHFVRAVIELKLPELLAAATGSTFPNVGRDQLLDIPASIPPKEEQQVISRFFKGIDDKIEINRRINQTLEAMAQAIFKSWFADFEPVKAKIAAIQEGRDPLRAAMSAISGKPDTELDALPPEQYEQLAATAALFPDEMEESELGEIPKGWAVQAMPDCIDVNPSRTLKKGSVARYLDMANVPTNSARVQNIVSREFTSGSKFKNGDTLLARITPCLENGKTAFVDFLNSDEVGWGSTEFIVLRPKNGLPEPYAYFLCRYPDFRAFAISQMAGTSGRQRVPNDCFGGYKLVEPPVQVAVEFGLLAGVALNQIKALDEEARTLASLRDTLLPKLLSGELSVEAIAPTSEATP